MGGIASTRGEIPNRFITRPDPLFEPYRPLIAPSNRPPSRPQQRELRLLVGMIGRRGAEADVVCAGADSWATSLRDARRLGKRLGCVGCGRGLVSRSVVPEWCRKRTGTKVSRLRQEKERDEVEGEESDRRRGPVSSNGRRERRVQ